MAYTDAEQDFTFKVEKCDPASEEVLETYAVLLKFTADSARLETAAVDSEGNSYYYVQSKKFKVEAGYIYKVTETSTGLSWKCDFETAIGLGVENIVSGATVSFAYANAAVNGQDATVLFYDRRNEKSQTIESDMSSVTNTVTENMML